MSTVSAFCVTLDSSYGLGGSLVCRHVVIADVWPSDADGRRRKRNKRSPAVERRQRAIAMSLPLIKAHRLPARQLRRRCARGNQEDVRNRRANSHLLRNGDNPRHRLADAYASKAASIIVLRSWVRRTRPFAAAQR